MAYLKLAFSIVVCALLFAIPTESHSQMINTFFGPFHVRSNEFKQLACALKRSRTTFFFSNLDDIYYFIFHKIYLQIEFDKDTVEYASCYSPRIYTDDTRRTQCKATFHHILHPDIVSIFSPDRLYIKVPTNMSIKFPFNFHAFRIQTLRCIVRALHISSLVYNTGAEKRDYELAIESSYAKNISHFNDAVLVRCGIFLGFFRPARYEVKHAYKSKTATSRFVFDPSDILVETTQRYQARFACLIGFIAFGGWPVLLVACLGCVLFYLFEQKILIRWRVFSDYTRTLQNDLDICNIQNLASLETLLINSRTTVPCPFNNKVFLLDNGRILMLCTIRLYERNNEIIDRAFASQASSPVRLVNLDQVFNVSEYGIALNSSSTYDIMTSYIKWPSGGDPNEQYVWLLNILLTNNGEYRFRYVKMNVYSFVTVNLVSI
jgi:hypothetical protein